MGKHSDDELAVAMIYAAAMYALAEEKGQVDTLRAELDEVAGVIEGNAEVASYLGSPTVDVKAKHRLLERMFRGRCGDLLVDSLQVITGKDRQGFIGAVAEAFGKLDEERRGGIEVEVRTPVPLTESLRERIRQAVAERSGKKPRLAEIVDESMVGGLIVRIGDQKLDGSVARHLAAMSEALLARASRELHGGRDYVAA